MLQQDLFPWELTYYLATGITRLEKTAIDFRMLTLCLASLLNSLISLETMQLSLLNVFGRQYTVCLFSFDTRIMTLWLQWHYRGTLSF